MILRISVLLMIMIFETFAESSVDSWHEVVSKWVHSLSNGVDDTLAHTFDDNLSMSHYYDVDRFATNSRFLEETETSYIKWRTQQAFHSRESNTFYTLLSASLPLPKSNQQLQLFIEGTPDDVPESIDNDALTSSEERSEYGLQYIAILSDIIESKYVLGVRGISPFFRWRYRYRFKSSLWRIEPVQTFEYAVIDKFSERTDLYFDRPIHETLWFRLAFHRETTELERGMAYGGRVEWYWRMVPTVQVKLIHAHYGDTDYSYTSSVSGISDHYRGIYNSETAVVWRQNIWRQWLFYEVSPGVNYHKQHDYRPNYRVFFAIDLYFGSVP